MKDILYLTSACIFVLMTAVHLSKNEYTLSNVIDLMVFGTLSGLMFAYM